MVIVGAGGDLTKRLLVPALYNLAHTGLLPEHFAIVGVDLAEQDTAAWQASLRAMLQSFVGNAASESRIAAIDDAVWQRLAGAMTFVQGDLNDSRCFEKLREVQIYRIDHFLGKETVQNIMAFRFANGLFEPIWNRDRIDHVQISVAETVGVEHRGKFYERTGALRDMVPNHVFQLLAMVAMEPPAGFDAASIRNRKAEVFAALRTLRPEDAERGQYGPGTVLGDKVRPYRQEPDVAADSPAETFVAMRLAIDNWRWAGVPFYLRTGKRLAQRYTEIAIRFKPAPYAPFEATDVDALPPNWLVLHIQPDEGISLQFEVKRPGPVVDLAAVRMGFRYRDWFPREPNVGYETLIYDVMLGDQTLFNRADMVEETWRVVQPVLDAWAADAPRHFPNYAAGSEGPHAAEALLRHDHRAWRPMGDPAAPDAT